MRKSYKQLSIGDIYSHCKDLFDNDKSTFLDLLDATVDFTEFIPQYFYQAYYRYFGRKRKYPLEAFIAAFILQKIFTIPTDTLLIIFLKMSKELRDFCSFTKVPDASKFTRFKQNFLPYLNDMHNRLVDYTDPICRAIDPILADMLIYDTSGVEAYVTENNPKYINSLIKRLKSHYKDNPNIDPYKMAYGLMPSHAEKDENIKQVYANGHFCYAHKFGILTNGLGINRHIDFFDDEFKANHPEVIFNKKTDNPDEDKSIGDSTSLKPVLNDFFAAHPNLKYSSFLGDSAFDSIETYTFLKNTCGFSKVFIPLNNRNTSDLPPVGYNEYGYPTCPNDNNLAMKYSGITKEKGRADRFKWICPMVKTVKGQCVCSCENPCSNAKFGRTAYTYNNIDFRLLPGVQRDSEEWVDSYKIRTAVERTINHLKSDMCIADRKSRDIRTAKADLLFASIAQLFTVVVADRLHKPEYFRSVKRLIA